MNLFSSFSYQFFYEEINNYSQTLRERKTRYGIFIKIMQTGRPLLLIARSVPILTPPSCTGKISRFSWNVFFINFTSGLGLLALAGLLVDVIAVYILPEKTSYSQRKFSEIARSGQKMSVVQKVVKTKKH